MPDSVAEHLAALGVTVPQARDFVLAHLDNPHFIAEVATGNGITHDELAQIVGGEVTGLEVAAFFAQHDIDTSELEEVEATDTLDDATALKLAELGVTREEVRSFLFAKFDELHAVVDLARENGVDGQMIADIMGHGAIGQQVAAIVRGAIEEEPAPEAMLVGQPSPQE
ncbi:MAG: hypothetical protein HY854_21225 [Burkholderiales bacterium]|nr:hypothetical protein [Burkholderiales bacterium]